MKSAARGKSSGPSPSTQGAGGFAWRVVARPVSKTVVVSDDGWETYTSVAADTRMWWRGGMRRKQCIMPRSCRSHLPTSERHRAGDVREAAMEAALAASRVRPRLRASLNTAMRQRLHAVCDVGRLGQLLHDGLEAEVRVRLGEQLVELARPRQAELLPRDGGRSHRGRL